MYLKNDNDVYNELIRILKDEKLTHKEYDNFLVVAQSKNLENIKINSIEIDGNAINLFFKLTIRREMNNNQNIGMDTQTITLKTLLSILNYKE
ncbi:hypothetical protein ONA23_02400 [Mycoplasmopsis cynos]|uniref:hypothetical protein n=1 Tax=Mycoplasmopsis cynos TaxID=171284 RepID=UPI002206330D|nr:hypothetical protein [Mycoplasmopsis cynos]UWV82166.1 hypothetical protein NW067_03800 [Mycoplasmopsis cynos]UWV93415.1 hypothetical protein NW062_05575 [Mycoplasmopsis cynos]WAM07016.1 hypothetical protein ONA23_02400 [Mycoplasmopsis cynos]